MKHSLQHMNNHYQVRGVLLILMSVLTFASQVALGQTIVSGVVRGKDGKTLPGASVLVKGTNEGVVADFEGRYNVALSSQDATLVFSYVGYETVEVSVNNRSVIDVDLGQGMQELSEVMVTALGMERETKALGYAVQEVQGSEITQAKESNFMNSLSGRVSGVQITNGNSGPGSATRVVIRGESSFSNNEPLFVVDGIPINNSVASSITNSGGGGPQEVDYGNSASEINPDDIETITVLKGANAAALYGSRAAAGVILITTRKGSANQGLTVSVNSSTMFEKFLVLPKFQNEYGQGSLGAWEYYNGLGQGVQDSEDLSWGPKFGSVSALPQFDGPSTLPDGQVVRGGDVLLRGAAEINSAGKIGPLGLDGAAITPTEWRVYPDNVNDFFENGLTTNNNISIAGGGDNSSFRFSYTHLKSNGIIPNTDLVRNSVAINGGYKITNKFNINASANYIKNFAPHRPGLGYGSENPMYVFAWYGRSVNTKALRDYWQRGYEGTAQYNYNYAWHDNPYLNMFENTNSSNKNRLLGNVTANYQFTDELSLMLRTGQDFFIDNRVSKRVFTSQRFPFGMFREDDEFFQERNSDFLLTYDKSSGPAFGYSVSVGGNTMNQQRRFTSSIANQLAVPNVYSLANARTPVQSHQFDAEKEIHSVYGTARFSYLNSIFLELTARSDWSSVFYSKNPNVPNEGNYTYPSASLSAVVSDLITLPSAISFARLRAGYAEVGNDTQPFSLVNVYTFQTPYNNQPTISEQSILNNTGLVPERQKSWETGTDLRFLEGRLSLDVTYYNTLNENQIIRIPVSKPSGYEQAIVNGGQIRTFGIEATLTARPFQFSNGFNWEIGLNFTKNDSEVKKVLPGLIDSYTYTATTVYSNTEAQVYATAAVGGRMGDIYGTGFAKDPDGNVIYNNGVPVPSNEIRKLGNYNPDFMLGINNRFSYKNFALSFLFDWRQGGVVVSRMTSISNNAGTLDQTVRGRDDLYGYNGGAIFDTGGNPLDPNTAVGIIGEGVMNVGSAESPVYQPNNVVISSQTYFNRFYSRSHEESNMFDASFVKFRELTLMYTLPSSLLSNIFIREASIGFIGRNLALWTSQEHFDPETLTRENDAIPVPGVEEMAYPSMTSYGVNLSFKF